MAKVAPDDIRRPSRLKFAEDAQPPDLAHRSADWTYSNMPTASNMPSFGNSEFANPDGIAKRTNTMAQVKQATKALKTISKNATSRAVRNLRCCEIVRYVL